MTLSRHFESSDFEWFGPFQTDFFEMATLA